MQMKYHILLPSIYYGVLYFGCILKYNHDLKKKKDQLSPISHTSKDLTKAGYRVDCRAGGEPGFFTVTCASEAMSPGLSEAGGGGKVLIYCRFCAGW